MKEIIRERKVVEKQALAPDGALARVQSYYNSYNGYLTFIPSDQLRGLETSDGAYILVDDNSFYRISEERINNVESKNDMPIKAQVRVRHPAKDWEWADCVWQSGRLKYKYKETDFVDSEKMLVVDQWVTIREMDHDEEFEAIVRLVYADNLTTLCDSICH